MAKNTTLYGHRFCPQVHTIRAALDHIGLRYEYIDIRKDESARLRVKEINSGNESVPTVVFSDGSSLTEPSEDALYIHLDSIGFRVDPPSTSERIMIYLGNPIISAFGVGVVIGGGLFNSLTVAGVGVILFITPLVVRLIPT
jgi:mycoredoxin